MHLRVLKILGVAFSIVIFGFIAFVLAGLGAFDFDEKSPYEESDICFSKDWPGATSRFTTFTPISCSNPNKRLGEPIGADYANLRFEDVDGDGKQEGVVESSRFRCRYGTGPCYDVYKIVFRVCASCNPKIEILQNVYLQELSGPWEKEVEHL